MRKHLYWLLFLTGLSFGADSSMTAISASLVLKVDDRAATARLLVKHTEDKRGYFSNLGENFVTVKLPNSQVTTFLAFCDSQGIVIDRHYIAQDYSAVVADKQVKIKARRDLLKDYFEVLQQSTIGSVLTVEGAISNLTAEIESLEADMKVLRHKLEFAEIRVDFEFRERHPPLKSAESLFKWINTLNLAALREDFENGRK